MDNAFWTRGLDENGGLTTSVPMLVKQIQLVSGSARVKLKFEALEGL